MQRLIQELTGDWQTMVRLTPEPEPAAGNAPEVLPAEPVTEAEAEIIPHRDEDISAEEESVSGEEEELPGAEEVGGAPAAGPDGEPPLSEPVREAGEEEPFRNRSLMGDPEAVEAARRAPMVQMALELFGGDVADIIE